MFPPSLGNTSAKHGATDAHADVKTQNAGLTGKDWPQIG
jgi:hypothetical protein